MTVRVDSLRNTLAATIGLLEAVGQEAEDLHVLAYDRKTAAEEAHVAGGSRDYALDTHGDPRAREAFRDLGDQAVKACQILGASAERANRLLRASDDGERLAGKRTTAAVVLADAIAAQARRIADGTFVPVRRLPQPDQGKAWSTLVKSKEHLDDENRRLRNENDRLRAEVERLRRRRAG